jgi:hypothetical protein
VKSGSASIASPLKPQHSHPGLNQPAIRLRDASQPRPTRTETPSALSASMLASSDVVQISLVSKAMRP